MKRNLGATAQSGAPSFSALGRAVWDETVDGLVDEAGDAGLSVLSVEPYGMKPVDLQILMHPARAFQCSRSSRMG